MRTGRIRSRHSTGSTTSSATAAADSEAVARFIQRAADHFGHAVALLWNGTQRASFAGHVDTSRPLRIDPALVQAPAAAAPGVPSP